MLVTQVIQWVERDFVSTKFSAEQPSIGVVGSAAKIRIDYRRDLLPESVAFFMLSDTRIVSYYESKKGLGRNISD